MISFSQKAKKEISEKPLRNICCTEAAAYGIACFGRYFDTRGVVLHTENAFIAQWAKTIYEQSGIIGKVFVKGNEPSRTYEFAVKDSYEIEKMLALFGHTGEETTLQLHEDNFRCDSCYAAFTAAAFLCCGTIVDPKKSYNLEFVATRYRMMEDFAELLSERGFSPKRATRKGNQIVYFKASEQIEDLLTYMGASKAALEIMNLKIYRDFRNKANRITNCETANIDKLVAATQQSLKDIALLEEKGILQSMPEAIQQAAALRRQNPTLSLAELASISEDGVSKSGLSHRYRKIAAKANELRDKQSNQ